MKILMVCLGNICRSPLAEGIMRKKLEIHRIEGEVDSAGTANYHIGEQPDIRAIKKAAKYGIDISKHSGRQISTDDFDRFETIYVMDLSNLHHVHQLARNINDKNKVKTILDIVYPNQNKEVPDPYYGDDDAFENVYHMLSLACEKICKQLKKTNE